ncbi:MAG: M20/M25/M40 family metallo-hydrolase, partial [Treponema sp.]|nr:M20/M25/M40 family metallo-hydrolase [Treponema sp.]
MTDFEKLKETINADIPNMVALEKLLTSIPAMAPESGGDGELEKCERLAEYLRSIGLDKLERYDAKDGRVSSGIRPNMIATIEGEKSDYNIWIMAHMDVVPPGDLKMWDSDPWTVIEKNGKLIGRGVEDNQQGLVSGVFAAKAL